VGWPELWGTGSRSYRYSELLLDLWGPVTSQKKLCGIVVEGGQTDAMIQRRVEILRRVHWRATSTTPSSLAARMAQVFFELAPAPLLLSVPKLSTVCFLLTPSACSQELRNLSAAEATSEYGGSAAPPPRPPPPPPQQTRKKKPLVRRMPDHILPPYLEANFRLMSFVLTRAPKLTDFPQERLYNSESIDLLFRHYYKNRRA
jgi:hypothetical protein